MASDGWDSPRLSEDLQLVPAPGGPQSYGKKAQGPVEYVTVANDDGVLGYLWANDAGDAAGYVVREAAGDVAFNAGVFWSLQLRPCKDRGLAPTAALTELAEVPGSHNGGWVVAGSRAQAPDLATLKALADRG
jgi:hypothetical protein